MLGHVLLKSEVCRHWLTHRADSMWYCQCKNLFKIAPKHYEAPHGPLLRLGGRCFLDRARMSVPPPIRKLSRGLKIREVVTMATYWSLGLSSYCSQVEPGIHANSRASSGKREMHGW